MNINFNNSFYGNYARFQQIPKISRGLCQNVNFNTPATVSFKQNISQNDLNKKVYQIMKDGFEGQEPEYTRVTSKMDEDFGIAKIKSFFDKNDKLRKEIVYSQYNTPLRMSLYDEEESMVYNAVSSEVCYDNICIVEIAHFDGSSGKVLDYRKNVISLSKP